MDGIEPDLLTEETAVALAALFKAFSDPTRVRIIAVLAGQEQNVGDIATSVGMSESAVSHHLSGLRQLRLVRVRREGRQMYYSLDDEHVANLFEMGLEHVEHARR